MAAAPEASPQGSALTGVIALLGAATLIGFAPIFVKLSDLGPQAIAFWRLVFALPALALWLAIERRGATTAPKRPDRRAMVLAGVFFSLDLAFWHAGIKITTAANATLLANLAPVIVTAGAWLIFKQRPSWGFAGAAVLALGGAMLLSLVNVEIAPERLPGDALSAMTAVWYAAYLLAIHAARRGASTPRVMLWSTAVATPFALAFTLGFGEPLLPATPAGWLPLIALGVIVHAGGQGGVAFGLGRVPAPLASLIILFQPVVAACAGWIIFGEALTALQIAGAGLVLAGVYIAQRLRVRGAVRAARERGAQAS
ncbi:EamA/RhaT family transporter [Marinicauda salina]|uniref:EamA/RhaT family transporter n=1 Tax=Marinicauda salina TaxID=2135793 RepID=A0A2U2BQS6_9PROT|nr:EamA family transporter [Marinicauda salina]PWE16362.1 EamA/RhaT family transporter [Marinicauda salina]